MTNKTKKILIFLVQAVVVILTCIYLGIFDSSNRINEGVYIRKTEKNTFDVYFEKKSGRRSWTEITIYDVDSLIISPKFGTMIYGSEDISEDKNWFYFDASPNKNLYGPWRDSSFRKNEIVTIGFEFLDSVRTSREVYEQIND